MFELTLRAPPFEAERRVLTPEARAFLAALGRRFTPKVHALLARRRMRHEEFDAGVRPGLLEETASVRSAAWTVAPVPPDLVDRRVEITGPVDRRRIINGLNSGAQVFMADFEDATTPTWRNLVEGQDNLREAVAGRLRDVDAASGRVWELGPALATLCVRPRGWHLLERHIEVDGAPLPGALFDFGLYLFHNARVLLDRGSGPYFYLPKLEGHLEARLWSEVFEWSELALGLRRGAIRATVLVETLPAAFELDEILWELREHVTGLNCGRWDYIFSYIKTFAEDGAMVLPDRACITMDRPFLRAWSSHVVQVCHRRGAYAIGGMAAQVPLKDPVATASAVAQVRADKERELAAGHDGTWVAHPALVPVAAEVFANRDPRPLAADDRVPPLVPEALFEVPAGTRTEAGLREALEVSARYLASWLAGTGCVALHGRMEDAATAEICRSLVWQWIRHGAPLDDGRPVTIELVREVLAEEVAGIGPAPYLAEAEALLDELLSARRLAPFLTLSAYEHVLTLTPGGRRS